MGDAVSLPSDPQSDRHRSRRAPQAAAATGLHAGVPKHPGLLDAAGDGGLPERAGPVRHDVGPDRRESGGQPAWSHRAPRPQTASPSLPADAAAPSRTAGEAHENLTPDQPRGCARQCHS